MQAVKAGALYFIITFALGFILGTIRVLLIAPRLGEAGAVLLELPVMLAASWVTCGWVLRRLRVRPVLDARLTMGSVAFALLMLAELGVAVYAFGRTPAEHFAAYQSANTLLGLAGQIAFAAIPLLRLRTAYA